MDYQVQKGVPNTPGSSQMCPLEIQKSSSVAIPVQQEQEKCMRPGTKAPGNQAEHPRWSTASPT